VDGERLSAELAEGVLTVRIPKHPKAQPRRIQIGDGGESQQLSEKS
jgi:HSP20 family molecular chaperone IbpA